jgi:hypothetical protein
MPFIVLCTCGRVEQDEQQQGRFELITAGGHAGRGVFEAVQLRKVGPAKSETGYQNREQPALVLLPPVVATQPWGHA